MVVIKNIIPILFNKAKKEDERAKFLKRDHINWVRAYNNRTPEEIKEDERMSENTEAIEKEVSITLNRGNSNCSGSVVSIVLMSIIMTTIFMGIVFAMGMYMGVG